MSKITIYRQLLTAIHENDGFNNWDSNGAPDLDLAKLDESAEQDGLITVRMGWSDDRYFRLTNAGRAYISLPQKPGLIDRLSYFSRFKRSSTQSRG